MIGKSVVDAFSDQESRRIFLLMEGRYPDPDNKADVLIMKAFYGDDRC